MFLGFWQLETTLALHIQLASGNAPVTARNEADSADAAPTFQIYSGASSTPIATGTCSDAVDSKVGWHLLSQALTVGNGFAVGVYAVRVAYFVAGEAKAQEFVFQIG